MTTLDLTDADGDQWRLYQVQLSEDATQATADTFTPPGSDGDDTFISVLSEQESFTLTGLVTANRLSGQTTPNAYDSDWRTALAEYAQRGEAFASGAQHTGYTLNDADRGRASLNVVIESFAWTLEAGAPYQLSYELTLRRGNGLLPNDPISVGSATPGSLTGVPTLGGTTLHGFDRLEMDKSMELSIAERAFAGAGDNDVAATRGMERTFTYRGRYPAGKTPDQNQFDDDIRNLINDNTQTFATIFPGYSVNVKVLSFESPRSWRDAGRSHDYSITMQEAGN